MPNSLLPFSRGAFFAIQETNTDHRKWKYEDQEQSQLIYDWSPIMVFPGQSQKELLIEVSRTFRERDHDLVIMLADSIFQSERLEVADRIFAVQQQTIRKIGYVERVDFPRPGQIAVYISWVSTDELGDVKGHVFKEAVELQPLGRKELKKIERQFKNTLPGIYDRLPPDEKQDIVRLESMGSTDRFLSQALPEIAHIGEPPLTKEEPGGTIRLFYGTNRELLTKKHEKIKYGTGNGPLQFGFCEVHIPKGHIQGELERPDKFIIFELPENEKKHVVIKTISSCSGDEFRAAFIDDLRKSPEQHALLFIHGYNNSFEEAARRTAQIAWDLPFDGLAGFFSWPSSGKLPDYLADEAKARSSAPALLHFLRTILGDTGIKKLHLIAHSMGNQVMTLSLNALKREPDTTLLLSAVQQLILAAPDIDQEEFRNTILPEFKGVGARRTIYASDHDSALSVSSFLRRDRKRLGQIGENIFLDPALDTIEASNIRTDNSHSYMFENQILLSDIYYLINRGLPPVERRLRKVIRQPLFYWLFPR
jgi:esterase/lipase superfamily enzyme